jgi:hypothetical protein
MLRKYRSSNGDVCSRWLGKDGFQNFIADLGSHPVGTTLGRIDANLGFIPDNCKWVPRTKQTRPLNDYYNRPRRVRPTSREGRARRTELLRLLRNPRVRQLDKTIYAGELDRLSPIEVVTQ